MIDNIINKDIFNFDNIVKKQKMYKYDNICIILFINIFVKKRLKYIFILIIIIYNKY